MSVTQQISTGRPPKATGSFTFTGMLVTISDTNPDTSARRGVSETRFTFTLSHESRYGSTRRHHRSGRWAHGPLHRRRRRSRSTLTTRRTGGDTGAPTVTPTGAEPTRICSVGPVPGRQKTGRTSVQNTTRSSTRSATRRSRGQRSPSPTNRSARAGSTHHGLSVELRTRQATRRRSVVFTSRARRPTSAQTYQSPALAACAGHHSTIHLCTDNAKQLYDADD